MRNRFMKAAGITAVLAAAVIGRPAPMQAQGGLRPILEVRGHTVDRDGGTSWDAKGDSFFVPGQPITWYVVAGSADPDEMTVCGGGVSEVGSLDSKLARNSFVWQLTLRPASYDHGRATFDLEWARYRRDGGTRPSAQGKLTLSLAESQRQVVDLVHGAPGKGTCQGDSTVIEIGAGVREDPRFAEAILQYDLWLTHQGRDGRQQVRHFTGMGMQGAELAFAFVPLRFQVPQRIENQAMYDVTLSVAGTLRGRLQDDGRIALTIDTARREGLGPRDGSPLASHAGSGVKRLEVTGSEAVEIELPVSGGRSSLSAIAGVAAPPRRGPQPAPTEAVTVADGRVTVDDALFFEGQRTSLVLQIREVR